MKYLGLFFMILTTNILFTSQEDDKDTLVEQCKEELIEENNKFHEELESCGDKIKYGLGILKQMKKYVISMNVILQ